MMIASLVAHASRRTVKANRRSRYIVWHLEALKPIDVLTTLNTLAMLEQMVYNAFRFDGFVTP